MKKEMYESAQSIMDFSQIFADAMNECMTNAGLLADGFTLKVIVQNPRKVNGTDDVISCTIDMSGNGKSFNEVFIRHKNLQKGWEKIASPRCDDDGTVSPEISSFEKAARVFKAGQKAEKPFAPDGLWLSSRDDYCDVDCRGTMK